MRRANWMNVIAGLGLVVAASAQPVRAQAPRAAALEGRASALLQTPRYFGKAAALYRRAAALRPAADTRTIEDLRLAGLLYADAGKLGAAGTAMEGAGERALALGRPAAAAEAFTNAAFIAASAGERQRTAVLVHRALWLADLQGVTPAQRAQTRARLGATVAAGGAR